jgi:NO-binding membrane sensor protein with MHYT domain
MFACSVSMGLVGIWCMHFVGNRAIIMGNGDDHMQLVYSSGFTALSVFLPVIFLFIGFSIADMESQKHRGRLRLGVFLGITGVAAGLSIVGMHYIGNFGILNYKLSYSPKYVGSAVIVAVVDATGALAFFFSMKELWINKWWSRLTAAIFLAVAVSGMHWVASVGVTYRLKDVPVTKSGTSRNVNLIIAVALVRSLPSQDHHQ